MQSDEESHSNAVSKVPTQPTHSPSYQQSFIVPYDAEQNRDESKIFYSKKIFQEIKTMY
jgi:hypothetical protein